MDVRRAMAAIDWEVTEVVSGGARGADTLGEKWASDRKIPIKRFPADWSIGKHAGHVRNAEMAEYGDALVALWNGISPGTRSMIKMAQLRGLKVFVYRV